jgi:hypothetical protein
MADLDDFDYYLADEHVINDAIVSQSNPVRMLRTCKLFEAAGKESRVNDATPSTTRATTLRGRLRSSRNADGFHLIVKETIALQLRQDLLVRHRWFFAPLGDSGEIFYVLHQLVELLHGQHDADLLAGVVGEILKSEAFQRAPAHLR